MSRELAPDDPFAAAAAIGSIEVDDLDDDWGD